MAGGGGWVPQYGSEVEQITILNTIFFLLTKHLWLLLAFLLRRTKSQILAELENRKKIRSTNAKQKSWMTNYLDTLPSETFALCYR